MEDILRELQRTSDPAYLHTVSMNELYRNVYQSRPPIIDGLLYPGTYLFAGAPKVGKSFLMAQLAYHVSMGLPLWGYPVHKGTVLYLALEDDHRRLQGRLYRMFGMDGTNDLLFLSPDTVRKNMARMVDISLARGVTPILGTITPDSRGGKPISQTNALLRELATQKKIALADLYAAVKDSWSSLTADGLHPNSAGYSKIAQVWTSAMDEADKMNAPPTANLTPILMLLLDE